jgi:hypothetical protein
MDRALTPLDVVVLVVLVVVVVIGWIVVGH